MRIYLFVLTAISLISCGGGGGGGSAPSAPAPSAAASQSISVSLSTSAASAEVNSSITLTWSSTLATSCSASGSWSGSKGTSGSESIIIGVGGSNTFSLSCSASGANSGSASTSVNGLRYFDGKVFDGYIRGAEVFVDTNNNLSLDANEASASTDNAGGFSKLLFSDGTLVSKGGFDVDTGADLSNLTLIHKLDGFEVSKLASPFTTLIAYMNDASNINAALGIDVSINLLATDPIPNLGEGIYDDIYKKGNQLTVLSYTLQNNINDAAGTSQIYFQAIADQLEESYAANQSIVDIADATFISKVIEKVETARATTFDSDVKTNLNIVLSATIPLLKVYPDSNTTSSVQRFAFSTLQSDVKDSTVMIGNTSPTLLKYKNNVFEYVASDQSIDESTINPINNNAPTFSSLTSFSLAENQTSIGSVSASDADGDSLTYSISGSEINISSSGVLTFASAPDYETKNSYTETVTVSDGTTSATQTITVSITDLDESLPNQAPTINSSATFNAAENQTSIGSILGGDADGDSLTYSISGSEINISGSGVLSFASTPDYETKNSYTATVTLSDGIYSVTQGITVNVTDVDETVPNQAPIFTSSTSYSVNENQSSAGTLAATDADNDTLIYSLGPVTDNPNLNINSSTGVLTFKQNPDHELSDSYQFTGYVSDGTIQVSHSITIVIINLNDNSPVISSSATFSAAENQSAIGTVSASDADGNSVSYSISGSEINISSSGILTFASAPDYETKNSYTATVTVSDGGFSPSQELTVNVTNINEAPVAQTQPQGSNFSENSTGVVFRANSLDPDSSDTLSFSLTGDDAGDLNIDSNGDITFASDPNYELPTDANSNNTYEFNIVVTDAGGLSATSNSSINVTDVALASDTDPQTLNGTAGADSLQGGAGDDTLSGLGGDDLLDGGIGNDLLIGGDGDDRLIGGAGNDILWGGPGKDRLESGSGEDKFAIKSGEGSSNLDNVSWIENNAFEDGTDKVLLKSGLAFSDLTIVTATGGLSNDAREVSNGDYVISEANGGTKYLLIIKRSGSLTIDENDFVTE